MDPSSSDVPLIPETPEILVVRASLLLNVFLFVILVILEVAFHRPFSDVALGREIPLCIVELLLALLVIRGYSRLRAFQYTERQRALLTCGRSLRTLSSEISSQLEIAIPLSRITLIPQQSSVRNHLLGLSLLILLVFIPVVIEIRVIAGLFVFLIITLPFMVFTTSFLAYGAFSFLKAEITIEAAERGFQVERKGSNVSKRRIGWDEARLFVCYEIPDLLPRQKTLYYELSSATQVITWRAVSDASPFFSMWKPQLPLNDYHQQMQALCDLISARTGLELHDLREPREGKCSDSEV